MRTRYGWDLNTHYTDLAIVVGPNSRWVESGTADLMRFRPEVLLGYRVRMVTAPELRRLYGTRPEKVVTLEGSYRYSDWDAILDFTCRVGAMAYFPHAEIWRVRGPEAERLQ